MSKMTLPKLDSVPACPKCNGSETKAEYHQDDHHHSQCPVGKAQHTDWTNEHVLKRCLRCGYSWGEGIYRPDAVSKSDGPALGPQGEYPSEVGTDER